MAEADGRRAQLRMYTIESGRLDDFVAGWTSQVRPLRERFGFRVEGAWVVEGEDRFVWVVSYGAPGTFEERDAAYYASDERAAFDPDPAQWIVDRQTHMMRPIAEG